MKKMKGANTARLVPKVTKRKVTGKKKMPGCKPASPGSREAPRY